MFITLEGIEGSGKTTQISNIVDFIHQKGKKAFATREPGGTAIGRRIRSILLDPESHDLSPEAELLLYTADRVQHIKTVIQPHLDAGEIVICDRYFDATLSYQGYARGLDIKMIRDLHGIACRSLMPDMTLLLDLAPETGLMRAWAQIEKGARSGTETRFEKEKLEFHEKVRSGYRQLAAEDADRFVIIDAEQDAKSVTEQIVAVLEDMV